MPATSPVVVTEGEGVAADGEVMAADGDVMAADGDVVAADGDVVAADAPAACLAAIPASPELSPRRGRMPAHPEQRTAASSNTSTPEGLPPAGERVAETMAGAGCGTAAPPMRMQSDGRQMAG